MTYEEILKTLEDYFCDLLIIQYRQAPENRTLIKELVNLIFANNIALQIKDLTVDINKSIGVQLDIVGKWLGLDRYYNGIELWNKVYFSLPSYSHIRSGNYNPYMGGFSNYTNFNTIQGATLTYREQIDIRTALNKLGDEIFRPLLKLKAIKNSINHTKKNIDEAIYQWSNGEVYTTWEVMKLTYNYSSNYKTVMELAQLKNVLLVPCGCEVEIKEVA